MAAALAARPLACPTTDCLSWFSLAALSPRLPARRLAAGLLAAGRAPPRPAGAHTRTKQAGHEATVAEHRATARRAGARFDPRTRPRGRLRLWSMPTLRWLDGDQGPAIALLDQTRLPAEEIVVTCAQRRRAGRRDPPPGGPRRPGAGPGRARSASRWPRYQGDDVAAAAARAGRGPPDRGEPGLGRRPCPGCLPGRRRQAGGARCRTPAAAAAALAEARAIAAEDAAASAAMAGHGLRLVPAGARILTHCNTGALVSAGEGTAFAVILAAHRAGRLAKLWVDETRPLLQGARLTAWEARRAGIDYAVLRRRGRGRRCWPAAQVDLVLTGADRIAADGSVANKVGTYGLAVLARHHGVPFVVVAPGVHHRLRHRRRQRHRGRAPAGRGGDHAGRPAHRAGGQRGLQPGVRCHPAGPDHRSGDRAWCCPAGEQRVLCVCWAIFTLQPKSALPDVSVER